MFAYYSFRKFLDFVNLLIYIYILIYIKDEVLISKIVGFLFYLFIKKKKKKKKGEKELKEKKKEKCDLTLQCKRTISMVSLISVAVTCVFVHSASACKSRPQHGSFWLLLYLPVGIVFCKAATLSSARQPQVFLCFTCVHIISMLFSIRFHLRALSSA